MEFGLGAGATVSGMLALENCWRMHLERVIVNVHPFPAQERQEVAREKGRERRRRRELQRQQVELKEQAAAAAQAALAEEARLAAEPVEKPAPASAPVVFQPKERDILMPVDEEEQRKYLRKKMNRKIAPVWGQRVCVMRMMRCAAIVPCLLQKEKSSHASGPCRRLHTWCYGGFIYSHDPAAACPSDGFFSSYFSPTHTCRHSSRQSRPGCQSTRLPSRSQTRRATNRSRG
jgi:hypothetical protein